MSGLRYLHFEASDGDDGVCTLEAVASVQPDARAAVQAEVEQVLQWAAAQFPGDSGPVEDGHAWHHALLEQHEPGGWFTVSLTLVAAPHAAAALLAHFDGGDT
ncbi:hypothetical protein [Pseudorhodoferax sp.]|uniref:hypothetical protein n=1 Tax=Pseudorhodoferax sp. TaxID=1993553 RepID=UPI002DD66E4E|nr:hypothetical protein [Pseudorhodoferax sp.]